MKLTLEAQKEIAHDWFKFLQNQIYKEFEILEKEATKGNAKPKVFIISALKYGRGKNSALKQLNNI